MPAPNQPMTREEFAAALSHLDMQIDDVAQECQGVGSVPSAIEHLTHATLTVARALRLLAEPPPVEMRAESTSPAECERPT